uniref:Uncharacterized protein n=1 Tax=Ascaris lumbricoides TaxID=6252 RepID=A0A0M3HGS6_ASCLU
MCFVQDHFFVREMEEFILESCWLCKRTSFEANESAHVY